MTRPTKPVPAPAGASKPWQMFPPVLTTSRRSPFDMPRHAPSPRPPAAQGAPAPADRPASDQVAGDQRAGEPGSERPAMSAPTATGAARDS